MPEPTAIIMERDTPAETMRRDIPVANMAAAGAATADVVHTAL